MTHTVTARLLVAVSNSCVFIRFKFMTCLQDNMRRSNRNGILTSPSAAPSKYLPVDKTQISIVSFKGYQL